MSYFNINKDLGLDKEYSEDFLYEILSMWAVFTMLLSPILSQSELTDPGSRALASASTSSKAAHRPHCLERLHPDKAWIPDLFSIK